MPEAKLDHPVYVHDCSACRFLGGLIWRGERYDIYHCAGDLLSARFGGSAIARWGDEGPQYNSTDMELGLKCPPDVPEAIAARMVRAARAVDGVAA